MITNNPFKQSQSTWLVELVAEYQHIEKFAEIIEDICISTSIYEYEASANYESEPTDKWNLQAFFAEKPDQNILEQLFKQLCLQLSIPLPSITISQVEDKDWVSLTQDNFPAFKVGRYFIHGSHYQGPLAKHTIPLQIDAGRAFGTGEHETTSGCLQALSLLAKRKKFKNMLDMGCGTGILAIAMAKTWRKSVLAVDIDPQAVSITNQNCYINKVKKLVTSNVSNGYNSKLVKKNGQYDLVTSNILAKPLVKFAPWLKRNLRKDGIAILAGLLGYQERKVLSAHFSQNLYLHRRITKNNWHILVLIKK